MRKALFIIGGGLLIGTALVLSSGSKAKAAPRSVARVVALGDSQTEGGAYLAEVHRILGTSGVAIGLRGQGARAIYARVDDALASSPDVLVIQAGVNDVASGRRVEAIIDALADLHAAAETAGAVVVAVPIMPWGRYMRRLGSDRRAQLEADTQAVNDWLADAGVTVVDVAQLEGEAGELARPFDGGDGLHLSPAGHRRLGELIAEAITDTWSDA